MFCRQLIALCTKNFILKFRRYPETLWEIIFPLFCGIIAGILSVEPTDVKGDTPLELFQAISMVYFAAYFIITISFLGSVIFLLHELIHERETRIYETMKLMSMTRSTYTLSYFLTQGFFTFVTACILSIGFLLANGNAYKTNSPNSDLVFGLMLFALSVISMTMAASTFFTDSRMALGVGTWVLLLPFSIYTYCLANRLSDMVIDGQAGNAFVISYLLPNFSFGVILVEFYIKGGAESILNLNVTTAWWCLGLSIPFYLVMYLYFGALLPNKYGISAGACHCIRKKREVKKQQKKKRKEGESSSDDEEIEQLEVSQVENPVTVQVQGLSKTFGTSKAVDGINFNVSKGEVVVVLGHGGAGKTTLINMLSGFWLPTNGDASFLGRSLVKELEEIREMHKIGLCQQFDVLFPKLTVWEHLKLVCDLKSIPKNRISADIEEILDQLNLQLAFDRRIEELSVLYKRKVSLAMSLVGKSQIVILDEPTLGLDSATKRLFWDLIRKIKNERTILISTQNIEEADSLADRICVMAHGKMVALDTPESLRRNYGVGYNLIIESLRVSQEMDFSDLKAKADEILLKSTLQNTVYIAELSSDSKVVYSIPFEQDKKMSELLKTLEGLPQIRVAVEVSSLENAYVKIIKLGCPEEAIEYIQKKKHLRIYKETEGKIQFSSQFQAMFSRRISDFYRESHQWYLTLSPVFTILTTFFALYAMTNFGLVANMHSTDKLYYIVSVFTPFILNCCYATVSTIFIVIPVKEQATQTKHILRVSGMNLSAYWSGLLFADYCIYLGVSLVFTLLVAFVGVHTMSDHMGAFIGNVLGFGFALLSLTYFIGHFFEDLDQAIKWSVVIQLVIGTLIPIILIEFLGGGINTSGLFQFILFLFYLANPMFTFYLTNYNIVVQFVNNFSNNGYTVPEIWTVPASVWFSLGMYCGQTLLYLYLIIFLENKKFEQLRIHDKNVLKIEQPEMEVNSDVKQHETAMNQGEWAISCRDICKVYENGLLAVCQNSFGVKKGEVFGLLGPSKSGKTTALNMLSMQIQQTGGETSLLGLTKSEIDFALIGPKLGICAQHNTIWESLTVHENLCFMAKVKGLTKREMTNNIKLVSRTLGLQQFMETRASELSEGNKRKLSCALTVLVIPSIELLDEPTKGLDPITRRSIYSMIKELKTESQSAVFMTTRDIEEAKQFCDKVAIIVNGRIVCYGTPDYLIKSYGGGQEVTAIVDITKSDYLEAYQMIQNQLTSAGNLMFQGYQENSLVKWQMTFRINKGAPLSKVFEVMSKLVNEGHIESFTSTRTRLEEVFVAFSRFQGTFDKKEKSFINKTGRNAINDSSRFSEVSSIRQTNLLASNQSYRASDQSSNDGDYYKKINKQLLDIDSNDKKIEPLLDSNFQGKQRPALLGIEEDDDYFDIEK